MWRRLRYKVNIVGFAEVQVGLRNGLCQDNYNRPHVSRVAPKDELREAWNEVVYDDGEFSERFRVIINIHGE